MNLRATLAIVAVVLLVFAVAGIFVMTYEPAMFSKILPVSSAPISAKPGEETAVGDGAFKGGDGDGTYGEVSDAELNAWAQMGAEEEDDTDADVEPSNWEVETGGVISGSVETDLGQFAALFRDRKSGVAVTGAGTITRILADDNEGGRHQRFILRLASGQTLLVAHNIDIAPRVPNIVLGATVEFKGIYEYNEEGGVIHWTHRDPSGQHVPGWLKYGGLIYQ